MSHAGPKAARAFRDRQKRAFEAGQISAETWNRAEARRAANRLGDQWKKNPWLPGNTIDLGRHERRFQDALGAVDVDALPPAVLDWLRWRYRRMQIDRQDAKSWLKALRQDLPQRVADARPRPETPETPQAPLQIPTIAPRTWTPDADSGRGEGENCRGGSRRALPDRPRAPKVQRGKGYGRRGRPQTQPADAVEFADLMRVYRENVGVLEPIMAALPGEEKQLAVLRALRNMLTRPDDVAARHRWLAFVGAVQVR